MDEMTVQTLIQVKYSGATSEMQSFLNLAIQACAVVFGGIVLWRMSTVIHKKKLKSRNRNQFFETSYSKGWKRK